MLSQKAGHSVPVSATAWALWDGRGLCGSSAAQGLCGAGLVTRLSLSVLNKPRLDSSFSLVHLCDLGQHRPHCVAF